MRSLKVTLSNPLTETNTIATSVVYVDDNNALVDNRAIRFALKELIKYSESLFAEGDIITISEAEVGVVLGLKKTSVPGVYITKRNVIDEEELL